jgi:hypothetical protein
MAFGEFSTSFTKVRCGSYKRTVLAPTGPGMDTRCFHRIRQNSIARTTFKAASSS